MGYLLTFLDISDVFEHFFPNLLVFLKFFKVLDGLESSGRPVGIVSAYFRQNPSGGFRAMTKNHLKVTTKKVTTTNCSAYYYAQTLIVVVLIVVNFGWFLVIARNPPDGF